MKLHKRVLILFLPTILVMPLVAQADKGRPHNGYAENCYEHKGKVKCHGAKGHPKDKGLRRAAGGPPPWAPAHGWRRQNQQAYDGRYARADDDYHVVEQRGVKAVVRDGKATVDVGIERGTCNRKAVGTVLGGVVGGVIGNQVGKDGNREMATVLGMVIGGVVGHNIGRKMDEADHLCTGQALEQAKDSQTVHWINKEKNSEYSVTPQRTFESDGRFCRDYITKYESTKGTVREKSTACRTPDGAWKKVTM